MKKLLPYLIFGALIYWWLARRQSSAQTPEQIAYQASLPKDLYL
jgi:hypothetical protein